MTKQRLSLLVLIAIIAAAISSDAEQAKPVSDQLRLAAMMPSGAMLYVQASDFSALMKRWLVSPVRANYYKSDSFKAFSRSHAYLKLQDRRKDFETALGFGLDESRLSEIAGGTSAVALYDIGKIDVVLVTELPRTRAIASALFKRASQFEERSADGTSYYVREVTTDGGRLNQQFCFAYQDGKLIVTTAEGLMVRTLANVKSATADSLASVIRTAESIEGFAAHDVTMWLDQQRLNASRLFKSYWIHRNVGELAGIESAWVDLRLTPNAMTEQRWFKMKPGTRETSAVTEQQLSALLHFAPADAQLVQVRGPAGSSDELAAAAADVLFGEIPQPGAGPSNRDEGVTSKEESEEKGSNRIERYSHLDNRFELDVDDPDARGRGAANLSTETPLMPGDFAKQFTRVLAPASPASYASFVRSHVDQGKPFVRFERAIVISFKGDGAPDGASLERVITDELRARFVVSGSRAEFKWEEDAGARHVAQSLLERGAAYAISGNYLVLASSQEFAADILKAKSGGSATSREAEPGMTCYDLLRMKEAKPIFDTLTGKLDRPVTRVDSTDEEEESKISFFSQNVSSLLGSLSFRQVELTRRDSADRSFERLVYSW